MNSLLPFQKLPRFFRRHKLLRAIVALNGGEHLQRVRVNGNFDAFIDVRDGFARLVAIEESFETDFFALAKVLLLPKNKSVFFDVGANYGLMSFGLNQLLQGHFQAHLFEANPYLCEVIEKSAALNGRESFCIVNGAVMDSQSEVYLSFNIAHTGAGFVSALKTGEKVKSDTLDHYISKSHIGKIHLMKIDVEGNEFAVMKGADHALSSGLIEAVYFEYCPGHLKRAKSLVDPVEFLLRCGFDVFHFRPSSAEVQQQATHGIGPLENPLRLSAVRMPLETSITDLIALRCGFARKLT